MKDERMEIEKWLFLILYGLNMRNNYSLWRTGYSNNALSVFLVRRHSIV